MSFRDNINKNTTLSGPWCLRPSCWICLPSSSSSSVTTSWRSFSPRSSHLKNDTGSFPSNPLDLWSFLLERDPRVFPPLTRHSHFQKPTECQRISVFAGRCRPGDASSSRRFRCARQHPTTIPVKVPPVSERDREKCRGE